VGFFGNHRNYKPVLVLVPIGGGGLIFWETKGNAFIDN